MYRLSIVLALVAFGCSSKDSSPSVSDAGQGTDTSISANDSGLANDGAVIDDALTATKDAAVSDTQASADPCDEEPGKAKFCVTLKVAGVRPTMSAPADMAIDGKGKAYLALYDKDPFLAGAKLVQVVEAAGGEIAIDNDFPVQIVGEGAPAAYSVIGFFADSPNKRGPAKESVLPGDYVTVQTGTGLTFSYPKIALAAGKVRKLELEISAVRRVTINLTTDGDLAASGKSVHGTGPVFLGLTDATTVTDSATWLHLDRRGCVNLNIQGFDTGGSVDFPVTVTGTRNIFAGVVDYDENNPKFPGQGSLMSAQSDLARVTINPLAWTASATVTMVDVAYSAVDKGTVDPTPSCQ